MSVSWEALCEDIHRAQPGSTLFYELIREAKRFIREGKADNNCPPPDTDYEISDEEFEATKAYLLEKRGGIPAALQRVIDRGGRFKRGEVE